MVRDHSLDTLSILNMAQQSGAQTGQSDVADFFLQNIIRPRPVPPYFCHGCSHRFGTSSDASVSLEVEGINLVHWPFRLFIDTRVCVCVCVISLHITCDVWYIQGRMYSV